jgi:hypothetical protein
MGEPPEAPPTADWTIRESIHFLTNGAWSWFQTPRALVDRTGGTIVVGSTANRSGSGGHERDGDVEVTLYDPKAKKAETFTLRRGLTSYGGGDDHNAPALWQRPDGGFLAIYAGHNNEPVSYYRIYRDGVWEEERAFAWSSIPGGCNFPATYSNLFYLSAEATLYNIARTHDRSPNLMVSRDHGYTWAYGGQLTRSEADVGYVNGYFTYASNGRDRIDFIATEHHPRDFNTSLYHGFVRDGKSHDTSGRPIASVLPAREATPQVRDFSPVFRAGSQVDGVAMTRAWNLDVQVYPDGQIAVLFQVRAADAEEDHRFFHAVLEEGTWHWEQLCQAGPKLIDHEEDYTGGGVIDRRDPFCVYISTPIDPRDGKVLANHEIFRGQRQGTAWEWGPITFHSTSGNFRPVIAAVPDQPSTLLWWKGAYRSSQDYDTSIVGIMLPP